MGNKQITFNKYYGDYIKNHLYKQNNIIFLINKIKWIELNNILKDNDINIIIKKLSILLISEYKYLNIILNKKNETKCNNICAKILICVSLLYNIKLIKFSPIKIELILHFALINNINIFYDILNNIYNNIDYMYFVYYLLFIILLFYYFIILLFYYFIILFIYFIYIYGQS